MVAKNTVPHAQRRRWPIGFSPAKERRQERAEERVPRDPIEQLAYLDAKRYRAVKERAKLHRKIESGLVQ